MKPLTRLRSLPLLVSALAVTLMGCSTPADPAPSTPASTPSSTTSTVNVDVRTHRDPGADARPDMAPFLTWKDADTLTVTTVESSTADCHPTVRSEVDQDGALALLLDYESASAACTDDAARWAADVDVPDGVTNDVVVRVRWTDGPARESTGDAVYQYEMGTIRPS